MNFTVFGSSGFIGQYLVGYLRSCGHEVSAPNRGELLNKSQSLGHVIYAVGMTGDFRTRPFDTVEAHVGLLSALLKEYCYESFLYLSSTRIYSGLAVGTVASESMAVPLLSSPDALYDLSKMLGESLCLSITNPKIRIARLSNVFGRGQSEHTFLGSILATIKNKNNLEVNEAPESCKDYVWVEDVVSVLVKVALAGTHRVYNLASGTCTTHADLAKKISGDFDCTVTFNRHSKARIFPQIDISRVKYEFGFAPVSLLENFNFYDLN